MMTVALSSRLDEAEAAGVRALLIRGEGRLLSGREAAEWGLVNRSVGLSSLLETTRQLARQAAGGPPTAFRASKSLIRSVEAEVLGLDRVLAAEAVAQGRASTSQDHQEGVRAFLENRPATFNGA